MINDLIIVGAGPAGMSAAIYMARFGKSVTVFEQLAPGGQAALTHQIDNYPGFEEGINGLELSDKMRQQAERFGVVFEYDSIESFSQENKNFTLVSGTGVTYQAKSLLITTGTRSKRLGVKGEDKFFGRGIGTCAVCDGNFYKGKKVAVIGGGNSALEESIYLADIVEKVYLIHRRDEFRGEYYVQEKIKNHPKIELVLNSVVEEFIGDDHLTTCLIKNVKTQELSELAIDGVFLYVGLDANTAFVDKSYKDNAGFIKVDSENRVNQEGLFAAGDCCSGTFKQVVIACGDGAKVSYHINHYLSTLE
ncbi:MAG: thioredoxin-disulfide reductase [Brevinema sp.]